MQLSLPSSPFPVPAVRHADAGHHAAATDPAPSKPADSSADSFESMIDQDDSATKSASERESSDHERTAAMLAAMLWAPAAPAPISIPLTAASAAAGGSDAGTSVAASVCLAPNSSRAFLHSLHTLTETDESGEVAPPVGDASLPVAAVQTDSSESGSASPAVPSAVLAFEQVLHAHPELDEAGPSADATHTTEAGSGETASLSGASARLDLNASIVVTHSLAETSEAHLPDLSIASIVIEKGNAPSEIPLVNPPPLSKIAALDSPVSVETDSAIFPAEKIVASTVAVGTAGDPLPAEDEAALLTSNPAQEKLAALPRFLDGYAKTSDTPDQKYFLGSDPKVVTVGSTSVGISVAKVNATMPAAAPVRPKSVSISESATAFSFSTATAGTATLTAEAPIPVATVRETLAAVITAVETLERNADIQQKKVDLQFHVGNEKLGLRVELRDGTVHTTFRTESSEMTSALAREWHNVMQPLAGREMRVADPVFSSSANAGGESASGSPGHGGFQHHESKASSFASAFKHEFHDPAVPASALTRSPAVSSSKLLNALA